MLTTNDIAELFALFEASGLRPPTAFGDERTYEAALVVWAEAVGDRPIPELRAALVSHLRDPERGRFWPTPADLAARIPALSAVPLDRDAGAWEAVLDRIRRGQYSVADVLDAPQRAALDAIGGTWAIRRAEEGRIGILRHRWLGLCRDGRSPRPALEAARSPALIEAPRGH